MKKQLAIAAGLAVLSTGAYASQSRVEALGEGNHWVEDTRRAFINPASINALNNYAITEWGDGSPDKPEGGFVRNAGSFVYGLYFNNDTMKNLDGTTNTAGTVSVGHNHDISDEMNGMDLFFGGDMGVQWGARLHYAGSSQKGGTTAAPTEASHSGLGLGLGMAMGDLQAYANLALTDKYEDIDSTTANDVTENGGMRVGVEYGWNNWNFYFDMNNENSEYTNTAASTAQPTDKYENNTMMIGAGHTHEVSSTARIYSTIAYKSNTMKAENVGASSTTTGEVKTMTLPLTVAFEADANSWLTLRGSISQSLLGESKETTDSSAATNINETNNVSTTVVSAGATLNFGKLKVDGIISSDDTNITEDELRLDRLMTRVAVHYWF